MGFQSPSAFSAITPTSPNWPLKPLQWVLRATGGPHHILLPISSLPLSGFHPPLFQSLPSPSVPLTSPSLGWALIHLELAPQWLNSAEESPQSAGWSQQPQLSWRLVPQNVQLSLPVSIIMMESFSVFPSLWNPSLPLSQWLTVFLVSQRK